MLAFVLARFRLWLAFVVALLLFFCDEIYNNFFLIFICRDEFKTLDYQRIYDSMAKPAFVFDGRGVVDIEALRKIGFEVYCIGKSKPKYSLDSPN